MGSSSADTTSAGHVPHGPSRDGPTSAPGSVLPLQRRHRTAAGPQPPRLPLPSSSGRGRSGPGLGTGPRPPQPPQPGQGQRCPLPSAMRQLGQPDEKEDCSGPRGRYAASHRRGLAGRGTGQLWAQARARGTPSSLAGDRRAARGPVPAADTQSTSVTCSLRSEAPRASRKAQHGQPATRPAGHSLPSESPQPPSAPSAPSANAASPGAPSKALPGEPLPGGSALTPCPPAGSSHQALRTPSRGPPGDATGGRHGWAAAGGTARPRGAPPRQRLSAAGARLSQVSVGAVPGGEDG